MVRVFSFRAENPGLIPGGGNNFHNLCGVARKEN